MCPARIAGGWAHLESIHYPVRSLIFVDHLGREKFALEYRKIRRLFDDRHFNFLRGDLERVLYNHIKDLAAVRFGVTVRSFEQQGERIHVVFLDKTTASFDLLVGADGVHSVIRTLAFGDEKRFRRYLGCHTADFTVENPTSLPVRHDAFVTLTVPRTQVAVYPIRGGALATFFLYKTRMELVDHTPATAAAELDLVFADMDWVVPRLLEHSRQSVDFYFDEVIQIERPRWSVGRVALVGDACQCLSLLAGQGASMAVFGAHVLGEELARADTPIEAALLRYEQRVKPAVLKRQAAGRSMAAWFIPDDSLRLAVRDLMTRMATWPVVETLVKRSLSLGDKP